MGLSLHVYDLLDTEKELDPNEVFEVVATDEGDYILPRVEIVAFQWGPPAEDEEDYHLYAFVRRGFVLGTVKYPE